MRCPDVKPAAAGLYSVAMERFRADTVTAMAATVTAVAALAVAVWDNVQSRSYNRLSVRPLVVLDAQRSTSDELDEGELVLSNQGVGPALLRDLDIRYEPIDGGSPVEFDTWSGLAAELRELGFTVTGWTDVAAGRALGVDKDITLFRFQVRRVDQGGETSPAYDVQHVFDAVSFEVDYESVYGEAFSTAEGRE